MSKKVLFIAYYFPPLAASGSLRSAALCRHFSKFGYEPLVLAADPDSVYPEIAIDHSLESDLPSDLRIKRIAYTTRLKQLLCARDRIRSHFGIRKHSPQRNVPPNSSQNTSDYSFVAARRRFLDRLFLFPDQQNPWIQATARCVQSLPKRELPDIILATGDPWSSLLAANRLAKKLNIPYVVDFRDPWIGNPKPPQERGLFKTAQMLEQRIIAEAAGVVANTDELRHDFTQRYPKYSGKFMTITNGFERCQHDETNEHRIPFEQDTGLELTHFGTVYELRNPFELLSALNDAIDEGGLSPSHLRIRFIGAWGVDSLECHTLAAELEERGYVVRESALPHDECMRRMREADCLLVLQQNFPLQIPAKIYEYISVRRPLLLIGGDGATKTLVETNGLGVTCRNDRRTLKIMLLDLVSSRQTLTPPSAHATRNFDYEYLTKKMADALDRILKSGLDDMRP